MAPGGLAEQGETSASSSARPGRRCAARGRGASRPSRARHPRVARRKWVEEPSSSSGDTTSNPFGFATALATFARNFVRAIPTVIGRPTSSRIRSRNRAAICKGCPASVRARGRRGTPRRSTAPRRAASCPRRPRTRPCSPRSRPPFARVPRPLAAEARAAGRPSLLMPPLPVARREHDPRRRRSRAARAGADRHAARPRRRRRRGRRAESSRARRTHVRITTTARQGRLGRGQCPTLGRGVRRAGGSRASWYEPIPAVSLELVEALGVSPEAAVIDVGGGGSFLADELVGRGFTDVTVLDISTAALAAT